VAVTPQDVQQRLSAATPGASVLEWASRWAPRSSQQGRIGDPPASRIHDHAFAENIDIWRAGRRPLRSIGPTRPLEIRIATS
jgi:hypothetical protein